MKKIEKTPKEKMFRLFDAFIENKSHKIVNRGLWGWDQEPNTAEFNIQTSTYNQPQYKYPSGCYIRKKDHHLYDYNFKESDKIETINKYIIINFSSQPPLYLSKVISHKCEDETVTVNLRGWRKWLPKKTIIVQNTKQLSPVYSMEFGNIMVDLTEEEFESRMQRLVELKDNRSLEFSENQLDKKLKEYTT